MPLFDEMRYFLLLSGRSGLLSGMMSIQVLLIHGFCNVRMIVPPLRCCHCGCCHCNIDSASRNFPCHVWMARWRIKGMSATGPRDEHYLVITAPKRSTVAKQLFVSKKFRVLKALDLHSFRAKRKKGKRLRIQPKARRLYKSRITFCLTFRNNPHFLPGPQAQSQHWLSKAHRLDFYSSIW